jgi:hypothetical protein
MRNLRTKKQTHQGEQTETIASAWQLQTTRKRSSEPSNPLLAMRQTSNHQ